MNKLTSEQLAYLAGYFDGEGSFSIATRLTPAGRRVYQAHIEVTSTNRELIETVFSWAGIGFITYRPKQGNANDAYTWFITGGKKMVPFIDALLPYLVLKKAVAENVRSFCASRQRAIHLARPHRATPPRTCDSSRL